jgi:hypothetical protein
MFATTCCDLGGFGNFGSFSAGSSILVGFLLRGDELVFLREVWGSKSVMLSIMSGQLNRRRFDDVQDRRVVPVPKDGKMRCGMKREKERSKQSSAIEK